MDQQTQPATRPFWTGKPARATRRGHFWVTAERVTVSGSTYQRGPMYVSWEAPERVTQPYPIVLVHGGTLQGTEWGDTPDGRPGWAQRFVEAGHAVLIVDRPAHGRSPYHTDILGPMGPPFSYDRCRQVYFPKGGGETQWPFDPADDAAFDAFLAPYGPIPADLAESQRLDADRLSRLLDRIGPAVVVTHSASGPDGWLVADQRPGLVVAIVAIEPMGPAFSKTPGFGVLNWGLTAAPVTYDPPRMTPDEARAADPASLRIPAIAKLLVAVVTGETSSFAKAAPAIVEFLANAGTAVEHLHLPDHGIHGNGHGLIYEKNSDQALQPILRWLETNVKNTSPENAVKPS
jgi:pimeloyl-ACP methyl ester carboxylesterase